MRKILMALVVGALMIGGVAAQNAPTLDQVSPTDGADGIATDTQLEVTYNDEDGDAGTITFYNSSDSQIYEETSVSSGTTVTYSPELEYGETFEWSVNASDGDSSTSDATTGALNFTTLEKYINLEDQIVDGTYTADAFSAQSVSEIYVDATIDSDESLTATLKGYNSTEQTDSEEVSVSTGTNTFNPSTTFSENTTTYALEFNASEGSVVINEAYALGTSTDSEPAAVAPGAGGWLTGNFFEGIPIIGQAIDAVTNAFNNLVSFLTEAWTP